ncbi:MAG: hypothetical protein QXG05_08005 [Nitrososphaerota archaeon]
MSESEIDTTASSPVSNIIIPKKQLELGADKQLVCKFCHKRIALISSWGRLDWYHISTNNRACDFNGFLDPHGFLATPDFSTWKDDESFLDIKKQFENA